MAGNSANGKPVLPEGSRTFPQMTQIDADITDNGHLLASA
jgi:hypothetical protein